GVAALHTDRLKKTVLHDFYELWPEKFHNVTNGVTQRRWMVLSNPQLAKLITTHIGDRWVSHLEDELRRLEPLADDPAFQREWRKVKAENKPALAALIKARTGVVVNPDSLLDVQGQRVYPAADLSEQISTAGKEASGTGNMKFSMNGALTIGTLDGANVEIREAVGPDNFFLFGLTAEEVSELKARGYQPRGYYESSP